MRRLTLLGLLSVLLVSASTFIVKADSNNLLPQTELSKAGAWTGDNNLKRIPAITQQLRTPTSTKHQALTESYLVPQFTAAESTQVAHSPIVPSTAAHQQQYPTATVSDIQFTAAHDARLVNTAAANPAPIPVSATYHVNQNTAPAKQFAVAHDAYCDNCCQDTWWMTNHPKYYKERPFGSYSRQAYHGQIANGIADQMVLYHYDFGQGDNVNMLSLRGAYQLKKFSEAAMDHGYPIVIQSTPGNPDLDAARRSHVLEQLKTVEKSATDDWVVVGRPRANGLRGEEAFIIDENNVLNTTTRGGLLPDPAAGSNDTSGTEIF